MIKRLWCFLWGHKIVYKSASEKPGHIKVHFHTKCPRCGKEL